MSDVMSFIDGAEDKQEKANKYSFSSDISNIAPEDVARPRILLVQAQSEVVSEGKCLPGKFWLIDTGYDELTLIPRGYARDNGIDSRTNKPYEALIFEVYVVEADVVATIAFKNSAMQAGREVNSMALRNKGYGNFAFKVGTANMKNKLGSWKVPTVEAVDIDAETLEIGKNAKF